MALRAAAALVTGASAGLWSRSGLMIRPPVTPGKRILPGHNPVGSIAKLTSDFLSLSHPGVDLGHDATWRTADCLRVLYHPFLLPGGRPRRFFSANHCLQVGKKFIDFRLISPCSEPARFPVC